jgi:EAL domain-containing protein (putative c-di-GMP-specific phosphodiesterase class I)
MGQLDVDLVHDLKNSVEDGSLVLQFQPEIDLASGGVVGMEALLRWRHLERGVLLPGEFLPVATAAGLMPLIGWWVLEECAREAASWQSLPQPEIQRQLWVNVAGQQVAEPGFADRLADLVARNGLEAGALGIEVTEETLARDDAQVSRILGELRAAGLALAVDDFGSWYSSLSTLGDLPVDAVKLDQSFVRGVGSDLEDDTIVASVIKLAHARGLYVVAEGVESWSESARLVDLECDRAFGYLFSPPQSPERARAMLTRGSGWRPSSIDVRHSADRVAGTGPTSG